MIYNLLPVASPALKSEIILRERTSEYIFVFFQGSIHLLTKIHQNWFSVVGEKLHPIDSQAFTSALKIVLWIYSCFYK